MTGVQTCALPIWKAEYRECVIELVSNRLVTEAKEMAEAVVLGDFPIDDDVLNVLVGSVSDIDVDGAAMFCKFMMGKGRFPNTEVLVNLCENLCKSKKGDKMWEIFRVLLEKQFPTDAFGRSDQRYRPVLQMRQ